jgi:D-aspartate ligase
VNTLTGSTPMRSKKIKTPAVVFGLFETGLGVIRSLGSKGVPVIGIDFKKDVAWYSRYANSYICPHPSDDKFLVEWLRNTFAKQGKKYPVFLTGDDFLSFVSRNRDELSDFLLFEMPHPQLIQSISNKYEQYLLALNCQVPVPETWVITNEPDKIKFLSVRKTFPLFIKGMDVGSWRSLFGGTKKGFVVKDESELLRLVEDFDFQKVPVVVQELIEGTDSDHFKYCAYVDAQGVTHCEFMLQKIRQYPIRFGVGSAVKSIYNEELLHVGRKFFKGIGYCGVGSAEFKWDRKTNQFKLIELNPRYWQQNYLPTFCGMNFPFIQYQKMCGIPYRVNEKYDLGKLWINRYMDFSAFLDYRKADGLSFMKWRKSVKGARVYPDFSWRDPLPFFYEFDFGKKIFRIPSFFYRKVFG